MRCERRATTSVSICLFVRLVRLLDHCPGGLGFTFGMIFWCSNELICMATRMILYSK